MKDAKRNAERWFREAENTLKQAEHALVSKDYNLVCFLGEQTAQKALKAALYRDGARFINIHSVAELIKEVIKKHPEAGGLFDEGAKLDNYYLSSRYPDAVPEPAIPSEIFIKDQAEEAVRIAKKILEFSRAIME